MRGKRGFTLIELVVVVAILGFLFTILAGITRALMSQQRYQVTRARLSNIESAMVVYVTQSKRLPCPANGRLASSDSNAGKEVVTGTGTARDCGTQQHGVVPWRELGLTASDIEDGWGGRLTYRVGPDLAKDGALDFTSCDPAGSAAVPGTTPPYCNTACSATTLTTQCTPPSTALGPAVAKGLVVENASGGVIMDPRGTNPASTPSLTTGAAYVAISHGPEGGGAYSSEGVLLSSSVTAGTKEALNFANLAYSAPSNPVTSAPPSYLVDDVLNGTSTTSHFDDIVLRPGILTLATKANLGARTH